MSTDNANKNRRHFRRSQRSAAGTFYHIFKAATAVMIPQIIATTIAKLSADSKKRLEKLDDAIVEEAKDEFGTKVGKLAIEDATLTTVTFVNPGDLRAELLEDADNSAESNENNTQGVLVKGTWMTASKTTITVHVQWEWAYKERKRMNLQALQDGQFTKMQEQWITPGRAMGFVSIIPQGMQTATVLCFDKDEVGHCDIGRLSLNQKMIAAPKSKATPAEK